MKKLLAIFFLSVYLISTTELSQLLKCPILVEHYFSHKEKSPEFSVIDFLVLHYLGNHLEDHPRDEDYEQDLMLPFMTQANVLSISFVNTSACFFVLKEKFSSSQNQKILPSNDIIIKYNFLSSIWQPPKHC